MRTSSIAACLALALVACGPQAPDSAPDEIEKALDLITRETLDRHVAYLADDALAGREAGEPGYDEAAAYVAAQLAAMGVEAAGIEGWYQPIELRRYRMDTDSPAATIHRGGVNMPLAYRDDFSMSADKLRFSTAVRAEVVYVGRGVHAPDYGYSDYDGVDVRGKIVAAFPGAPDVVEETSRPYFASSRIKFGEAVSRGAVGWISLRSRKNEERRPWDKYRKRIGTRKGLAWVNDDGVTSAYFPEIRGSMALTLEASERLFGLSPLSFEEALEAIDRGEPASAPLGVEVSMSHRAIHDSVTSANVVGAVRGTDPALAGDYVVYTAHLDGVGTRTDDDVEDTINNGAYDNAIGVALMLETARVFAAAPARRSMLFVAVTAEEKGLLGSDYFVNNPTVPLRSIVANVNLDMPLFLYPVADLVAFGSQHSTMHGVVETAAAAEGFTFSRDPIPEENIFARSDQYSFVRKGIPAVYLMTGFTSKDPALDGEGLFRGFLKDHYHQASDDRSLAVDWESALRFARAHTRIGYNIAADPVRPGWNEGNFYATRFLRDPPAGGTGRRPR